MSKRLLGVLFHRPGLQDDGLNLRRWFVLFLLYLVVLAVAVLYGLYGLDGGQMARCIWLLGLYLFYMSLCCTFFPAPTAWLILLLASPIIGLIEPAFLQARLGLSAELARLTATPATVLIVAIVGAFGTSMANLNEYHIFTFLLRFGKVHRLRRTRIFQVASRYFNVSPFWLMTAVNFLPVPIDVLRWLAITNRYPRGRFAAACFLGRFARYGLLAAAASWLQIGWMGIIIIQAVFIAAIALRYLPRLAAMRADEHVASCEKEQI